MPIYEFEMPTLEDAVPIAEEEHYVTLPVNKAIADALTVDGRAEVMFIGVVKAISGGYSAEGDYTIRVAVKKISVEPDNEFTELSREDDE